MSIPVWRMRSGELLVQEAAACVAVHFVRSGSFKCFKTSEDGYEQVLSFASREVIGIEAVSGSRHPASAAALEDALVYKLQRCHALQLNPVGDRRDLAEWCLKFPGPTLAQIKPATPIRRHDTALLR